jgi:alkylmercury lyase
MQLRRAAVADFRPEIAVTIEHLAARWAGSDTRLIRKAFPLLAEGRPVSVNRLAREAGMTTTSVAKALDTVGVDLGGNGDITGIFGITLAKSPHRINFGESVLFTCCALAAHVVPCLLEREVEIHSEDPVTRNRIRITIASDGLKAAEPDTTVASMIVTDERAVREDVPISLCQHVRHFKSSETADAFAASDTRRYVITLAELEAAARGVQTAIWS